MMQTGAARKASGSRLSALAESDRLAAIRPVIRATTRALKWVKERNQSDAGTPAFHCEGCLRRHHGASAIDKTIPYSTYSG
jgi:hypothetical protein